METPSATRRVTRSQTSAASRSIPASRKKEEAEMVLSRSRKDKSDNRSALFDITNDSPIVGVAVGSLGTSSVAKKSGRMIQTPGSGEALLRNQVKTLLQKVEEEEDVSKLSLVPIHQYQGLLFSPSMLLAPTPANTPLVCNLSNGVDITAVAEDREDSKLTQMADGCLKQEILDPHEDLITRALLFDDSPGKSEISESTMNSSVVTFQGSCCEITSLEEDIASVWSIQVNASSKGEDRTGEDDDKEEEEEEIDCEEVEKYYEEGYGEGEEVETIDELCDGLRKISIKEKTGMSKFQGRHTRFVYNSDDEIEGEEEDAGADVDVCSAVSPTVVRLKGLPTPEGKHLRFSEEVEDV